jgi:glycosyltransferase involved in cell wall biosynthesis
MISYTAHDLLAVIIPAKNAAGTLPRCLTAVHRSGRGDVEVVVVDDGSSDGSAEIAEAHGAKVLRLKSTVGPAAARNIAARATNADLLFFVDADVAVAEDAVQRVQAAFMDDPGLAAVFGSYDASPASGTFVSDYRNLLHHFVHQSSREESRSFWAGCGAVRRPVFLSLGGFDERYRRPTIEDIEFGWRCVHANHRVRLDKQLQGTHMKQWTLSEIVKVDIRDRAYPWSNLILQWREMPTDLNLQWAHRASAVLAWVAIISAMAVTLVSGGWRSVLLATGLLGVAAVAGLNLEFYRWLAHRRGLRCLAGAFCLHFLYYAYSSATFGWAWLRHRIAVMFGTSSAGARPERVSPCVDDSTTP